MKFDICEIAILRDQFRARGCLLPEFLCNCYHSPHENSKSHSEVFFLLPLRQWKSYGSFSFYSYTMMFLILSYFSLTSKLKTCFFPSIHIKLSIEI